MKHAYSAKLFVEGEEIIENSDDDLEKLIAWVNSQAEASFSDIKAEIYDNKTHHVIKSIQYSPPQE